MYHPTISDLSSHKKNSLFFTAKNSYARRSDESYETCEICNHIFIDNLLVKYIIQRQWKHKKTINRKKRETGRALKESPEAGKKYWSRKLFTGFWKMEWRWKWKSEPQWELAPKRKEKTGKKWGKKGREKTGFLHEWTTVFINGACARNERRFKPTFPYFQRS